MTQLLQHYTVMQYTLKFWRSPVRSAWACYKCAWGFHTAYAWQSFLVNNFADFVDVRVKKKTQISSCHWWPYVTATSPIGFKRQVAAIYWHIFLARGLICVIVDSLHVRGCFLFSCYMFMYDIYVFLTDDEANLSLLKGRTMLIWFDVVLKWIFVLY